VSATGFQGNTTTARFMQRIFSLHDASRIEVICIARAGDDGALACACFPRAPPP
jgi:hypothetical protein